MEQTAKYIYFAIILLGVPVWTACVWHYIGMLRRVKGGNFTRLMFDLFWWMPDRARHHLTEEGMTYYWRTIWLMGVFFLLVFAGMALTLANVVF